jgi:hypothetical protein
MDWIKLHALINEVPAAGIGIGALLLLIAMIAGGNAIKKIAFGFFAVGSVFSVLAFLSGPPARLRLETNPGVSIAHIEKHHNAANLAVWVAGLLGTMAVIGLVQMKKGRSLSRTFMGLMLAVSLGSVASTGWAAHNGVRVYTSEIGAQYKPHPTPNPKPHLPRMPDDAKKRNIIPAT